MLNSSLQPFKKGLGDPPTRNTPLRKFSPENCPPSQVNVLVKIAIFTLYNLNLTETPH